MENDHEIIVYDDVCPMCKAYTAGFVHLGWLKQRTGFAAAAPEILAKIDLDRARHEIPLLDTRTGEVTYGLNALFRIIGGRLPLFKPLFRSRVFRALLYPFYQIITYNRRVIAGSKAPASGFDCAPDVNLFYRWLYIGLAVTTAAWLFSPYAGRLSGLPELPLVLPALLLPAVFFTGNKLDFVGHWATVVLAGALLTALLPQMAAVQVAVAGLMCRMAWKRWPLTASRVPAGSTTAGA